MFTFIGLVASGFIGWRLGKAVHPILGSIASFVGFVVTLTFDVGPVVVLGVAAWLYSRLDAGASEEFTEEMQALDTELESTDPADYDATDEAWMNDPDHEVWHDDADAPSSDGGTPAARDRETPRNRSEDAIEPPADERDPYDIEW